MVQFHPYSEQSFFLFAITSTLFGYYAYYFLSHSAVVKNYFSSRFSGDVFQINWVFFQKVTGFLFMALVPAIIYNLMFNGYPTDFGITVQHLFTNWKWLLVISAFILLLSSMLARSPQLKQQYPQIRIKHWTAQRFALSSFGWIVYLIAYEFLFRGLLLFASYEAFGVWPAIAINVTIYSAVHLPKGMGETLGAIPFGILACVLTLSTGSILIPVVAHISLAVSMEYFAIKYNPDMYYAKIIKPKQIK